MPGRTNSPAKRSTSVAVLQATLIRSITSGVLTADSFHRVTLPVSAYGGGVMCGGTTRRGLIIPGSTFPSNGL